MAPKDGPELEGMLRLAISLGQPAAIRYPRAALPEFPAKPDSSNALALGKAEVLREGPDGAVLAYGSLVKEALAAAEIAAGKGKNLTVVNLRFAKPLDEELILGLAQKMPAMFTVEEHALAGGVGSAVAELLADRNALPRKLIRLGVPDRFIEHGSRSELLRELGLDASGLADTILGNLFS